MTKTTKTTTPETPTIAVSIEAGALTPMKYQPRIDRADVTNHSPSAAAEQLAEMGVFGEGARVVECWTDNRIGGFGLKTKFHGRKQRYTYFVKRIPQATVEQRADRIAALSVEQPDATVEQLETQIAPTLTADETRVFVAMVQNADSIAGGDFGIMEEMNYRALKLSAQQFGALVTNLQTKGFVTVHERHKVNGEYWVTQFTIKRAEAPAVKAPRSRAEYDAAQTDKCRRIGSHLRSIVSLADLALELDPSGDSLGDLLGALARYLDLATRLNAALNRDDVFAEVK